MKIMGLPISDLLIVAVYAVGIYLAYWGANKARSKGYNWWLFFVVGIFIPLIPAFIAEVIPSKFEKE